MGHIVAGSSDQNSDYVPEMADYGACRRALITSDTCSLNWVKAFGLKLETRRTLPRFALSGYIGHEVIQVKDRKL